MRTRGGDVLRVGDKVRRVCWGTDGTILQIKRRGVLVEFLKGKPRWFRAYGLLRPTCSDLSLSAKGDQHGEG